ncbi:MAG: glycerate dehydrogenase [Myxococcota bacterium]|jgi:glycerate dehydrogenase
MQAVFLNATAVDFDGAVDFGPLEQVAQVLRCGPVPEVEIPALAAGCAVVISKEVPLRRRTIEALPSTVRLICEAGTGYDNVDLEAARARGIVVCNAPGYSTDAVAQLTLTLILLLYSGAHRLRSRADHEHPLAVSPHEVAGRTLGIIGAGAIGTRVIELAREVGLRSIIRTGSGCRLRRGVERVSRAEVVARADVLSLHCPLTPSTRHLVDADLLAAMKPGAFLINTSRGGLVDQAALVAALDRGRLAGAALDVQDPEPLPASHPLWGRPDVVLTPHIGWKATEARNRLIHIVAENLAAFVEGRPIHVVS